MAMSLTDVLKDCALIYPELILMVTLCIIAMADVALPREKSPLTGWIALGGLGLALLIVFGGYGNHLLFASGEAGGQYGFSRMFVSDKLSDFFKIIFLLGTIAVVIFSMRSVEIRDYRHGEYYVLMLASVLGGAFLVSSNNFLMFFLALETLSMSSYVLAGYIKHDRLSAEASLKYILYGSVASAVMLFGISYLYGMGGTLDIGHALFAVSKGEDNNLAVLLSMVLVIGGAGFKMAAVPFHFWAPDVYQGAPTPITAFLSVVSKAAGFSAVFRMLLPLFAVDGHAVPDDILAIRGPLLAVINNTHLPLLFWILSVATMTLGNLVALRQNNVKRLLAYSSIAHAGYILMGLTVYTQASLEAMLFYFFAYMFMNLGAFLVLTLIINSTGRSDMEAFRGLFWKNPFIFIVMFIFLISLTGLPPTVGFLAKLNLFLAVVGAGTSALDGISMTPKAAFYYSLAAIGAINSAISLYYYMKLSVMMVFRRPEQEAAFALSMFDRVSLIVYSAPVVLLILRFDPLLAFVQVFPR